MGFVGSHIVDLLLERKYDVIALDNLDPQVHTQKKSNNPLPKNVTILKKDISNPKTWAAVLPKVDYILHQASAVGIAQSQYQIAHYCDVNVMGTAHMLDYLANKKHKVKKIIVAGSMASYGEGRYVNASEKLIRPHLRTEEDVRKFGWEPRAPHTHEELKPLPTQETDERIPNCVYAINKMTQEDLVHCFGRSYGIPTVALRYFNVYGPRQSLSNPYAGVLAIFASRLKNNHRPVVFEDGLQSRDFVHVRDVARSNIMALESDAANGESFNIGTGKRNTVLHLAEATADILGKKIAADVTMKFRKGDVRHCIADVTKAEKVFGFRASIPFESGLEDFLQWTLKVKAKDKFEAATKELKKRSLL